jgi:hypothetical protein
LVVLLYLQTIRQQQNFKLPFSEKKVHVMVWKIWDPRPFCQPLLYKEHKSERNVHLGGLGGQLSVVYSQPTVQNSISKWVSFSRHHVENGSTAHSVSYPMEIIKCSFPVSCKAVRKNRISKSSICMGK